MSQASPVFADATKAVGDTIIEVEGVHKYFGDFHALKDIGRHARTIAAWS